MTSVTGIDNILQDLYCKNNNLREEMLSDVRTLIDQNGRSTTSQLNIHPSYCDRFSWSDTYDRKVDILNWSRLQKLTDFIIEEMQKYVNVGALYKINIVDDFLRPIVPKYIKKEKYDRYLLLKWFLPEKPFKIDVQYDELNVMWTPDTDWVNIGKAFYAQFEHGELYGFKTLWDKSKDCKPVEKIIQEFLNMHSLHSKEGGKIKNELLKVKAMAWYVGRWVDEEIGSWIDLISKSKSLGLNDFKTPGDTWVKEKELYIDGVKEESKYHN